MEYLKELEVFKQNWDNNKVLILASEDIDIEKEIYKNPFLLDFERWKQRQQKPEDKLFNQLLNNGKVAIMG